MYFSEIRGVKLRCSITRRLGHSREKKKFSSFLFPSHLLSSPFYSLSLLLIVVTQIRGHIACSSPPLSTTVRALHFYREL